MQNIDQLDNQFQQLPMMFHQHIDVSRAPILSPNEQFFAYISKDLRINSINTRKKKFSFKPNDHINLVRYSQNSKYLFFCNYNYLNCLSSNNMKLIYSLKTKNVITDLHQIDNQLLICCKDIIIYDIFNKKNLIKIQLYRISSLIEFDKINNLILAVSAQQTIQFYERNCGKLVMSCETQKNDINFVQLINQSESLLGNNQQNLFLWQIDYSDQKLFLIRYFNSEWDQIKFFKSVDYDQKLIIRTQDNLYITDNQFLITYKLSIQSLYLDERDRFYQPQSMKYILLTDDTNYMILKQRSEVDE